MRPDPRRRERRRDDPDDRLPVPFDLASDPHAADLTALANQLAAVGERLRSDPRSDGRERPSSAFIADLRARLVAKYPETAAPVGRRVPGGALGEPWPRPVSSSVRARPIGILPAPRWVVLAVAAAVVVAVVGTSAGRLFGGPADAQASETVGATLVRDGQSMPLHDGTALLARDEVRVTAGGRATLHLGSSLTRLDGGADVRVDDLTADRIRLELLGGRSYYRVSLPAGGTFVVTTGPVRWTALGTAFDLDREPFAAGRERVDLLGLQHSVGVVGPNLRTTVAEGRAASVFLGANGDDASDLTIGGIDAVRLDDPWLTANARADRALGLPLGVLDRLAVEPQPTSVGPDGSIEPVPSDGVLPTADPNTAETPQPTSHPTAKPTAKPTPEPTPKPTPQPNLELGLLGCDGGVVIDWSQYGGGGFNHYITLRDTSAAIAKAYPPEGGAVVVDGTYSSVRTKTDAHDATPSGGPTLFYRTLALDGSDRVLAASPVKGVETSAVAALGSLSVAPGDGTTTGFGWLPYTGPGDCFSWYKLVYSADDSTPSFFTGGTVAFFSAEQGLADAAAEIPSGTYYFRLQVLRQTTLGSPVKFLVAESDVTSYTVP